MTIALFFAIIVVILAIATFVIILAYRRGLARGIEHARQSITNADLRALAPELDRALIITQRGSSIAFADPRANSLGIIAHNRIHNAQMRDLITLTMNDGQSRSRDIDHDGAHWRVTAIPLDDERCAVLVNDGTAQRRMRQTMHDLVSNISHELKTPVGAITLLAETIQDAHDDPDMVQYFADRMITESQRLTTLVHSIIELSRAEQSPDELQTFSVSTLVHDACERVSAQAHQYDIAIVMHIADDVRDAQCHASRSGLAMALKNIIENAVYYSPEHSRVIVEVTRRHQCVQIRVIDHGVGIPQEAQSRIFDRFYRVDSARSRQTGGSGLGLPIAKQYISAAHGTIRVWSRPHEGSTFTIELPLVIAPSDPAKE